MLWEDIRSYDQLDDTRYLSRVVGGIETDRLIAEIVDLLHTEDVDKVQLTCRAIRDLIISIRDDDHVADFQRAYHGSSIVSELERIARDGKRDVRRAAIYTLGKTGCTGSVPILMDVFRSLMQSDPLVLPEVLFEICWLDRSRLGPLVDEMLASPSFLMRWAALEGPGADIACGRLLHDPHDLVRMEAIFHLALIGRPVLPRTEARRKRKELESYRPTVSFSDLRIMFDRWLREGGRTDHSVDEVEMFVDTEVRGYITTKAPR